MLIVILFPMYRNMCVRGRIQVNYQGGRAILKVEISYILAIPTCLSFFPSAITSVSHIDWGFIHHP